jgi:putative tricarboxylic transport membrane protein
LRLSGQAIIGAGLVVLGVAMILSISSLEVSATYAKVGPAIIPYLIGACLVAVGAVVFWQGRNVIDETTPSDLVALGALGVGLLAYAVFLKTVGFVISSAILYFLVAWAFGSRNHLVNMLAAVGLSVAVYFAFNAGLGLNLPRGPLEQVFS